MKKSILIALFYCLLFFQVIAQQGVWTWMKGANFSNSPGNYGAVGVPSLSNEPPARYAAGQWTDTAGNFWVYGGIGSQGGRSDLWKFEPATNQWTWMNGSSQPNLLAVYGSRGVFDVANHPPALGYGMFTWVTPDNRFWLFGGAVFDMAWKESPDLWQYDPAVNQWAWMGNFGPPHYGIKGVADTANRPGGRLESNTAWVGADGSLWLFGGNVTSGSTGADLNDLWKYDIGNGVWTWMGGSDTQNNAGSYGVLGVPSVNNYPGARSNNYFWKDDAGNFWLAGGARWVANVMYQDVWKFNPNTLEWTWIKGPPGSGSSSPVGLLCDADENNREGARYENRAIWKICDNLVVNYCGVYSTATIYPALRNDLWGYMPAQNSWIKITEGTLAGTYGTKGLASPLNFPKARSGAMGFKDKSGYLWMYGGMTDSLGYCNDLWRYQLDTACIGMYYCYKPMAARIATTPICSDTCNIAVTVQVESGIAPYTYYWQPGGYTTAAVDSLCSGWYQVTVTDATGSQVVVAVDAKVNAPPPVLVGVNGTTLYAYNAVAYQWLLNGQPIAGATSDIYQVGGPGNYAVIVTDTNGCVATSNPITYTGVAETDMASTSLLVYPNPAVGELYVQSNQAIRQVNIYSVTGSLIVSMQLSVTDTPAGGYRYVVPVDFLPPGIYVAEIKANNTSQRRRWIKM